LDEDGYFTSCPSKETVLPNLSTTRGWLPLLALLAVWLGMTAAWVAVAVATGRPSAWMALVVIVDIAVLLHMTRARRGLPMVLSAVAVTALTIASAYWMITATYLGAMFGLTPVQSAQRLGTVLAWALTRIRFEPGDEFLLMASMPLAAVVAWLACKPSTQAL
jgi:hypothetical protein